MVMQGTFERILQPSNLVRNHVKNKIPNGCKHPARNQNEQRESGLEVISGKGKMLV